MLTYMRALLAWRWQRPPAGQVSYATTLALATLLLSMLMIFGEAYLVTRTPALSLPIDNRTTELLVQGIYADEDDARGIYRWTTGVTTVRLPGLSRSDATYVDLLIGPPAAGQALGVMQLRLGSAAEIPLQIAAEGRRYRLLVAPDAAAPGSLIIGLRSPASTIGADPRPIGIRLEGLIAHTTNSGGLGWPPLTKLAAQIALLLLAALLVGALGLPLPIALSALLLNATVIALISRSFPLLAEIYFERLVGATGLLLIGSIWLLPIAERRLAKRLPAGLVRALWCATLLAIAVRLGGALFPTFRAYDLVLNLGRLIEATNGTMVMTNESFEFGGGVTVYPPGPYLVLMPALLLGLAPGMLIQVGIGLIDGLAAFAVGLLSHQLGFSRRAALVAVLIYATVPVGLTTLYYGHTAQAFGQALMAPLAVALLVALRQPSARLPWIAVCTLFSIGLLSHIGVSILAIAWLGLFWLSQLVPGLRLPIVQRRLSIVLIIGGAIGFFFAYAPVVLLHLQGLNDVGERVASAAVQPSYNLIGKAWLIAFQPLGLALFLAGLLTLYSARLPSTSQALIAAWLASAALFCLVELATGLQVRYFVFLVPLVCIISARLLDQLAGHSIWGRVSTVTVLALLSLQGGALWYRAVTGGEALSMITILR